MKSKNKKEKIVGLIPAAGSASRISPIPCSKEIYPIGFEKKDNTGTIKPKVVSSYLLEAMKSADIEKIYMIIRDEKWDIPRYFKTDNEFSHSIAYLVTDTTPGVPFTIDKAFIFIKNKRVVFGFPDIIFEPVNAYELLIKKQENMGADLVLGLFKTDTPNKMDMVDIDDNNQVRKILIKPEKTNLEYTWIIAVWSSKFTEFLHNYITDFKKRIIQKDEGKLTGKQELYLGDIIQEAISEDLHIQSVKFPNGRCLDIGTPDDLQKYDK